jgi:iron complex transport system permease protein
MTMTISARTTRAPLLWTMLLLGLTLAAAWLIMALGSQHGEVVFEPTWINTLRDRGPDASLHQKVLLYWRAPRVVAGLVVGAGMAVAGLVLQGLTRNPLADPYLLGISGGGGLFVVLLHALPMLVHNSGWWLIPAAAFFGAQGATLLVLLLGRGTGGRITVLGLILGGVIINAFCAALMSFLLARLDPFRLRVTTLWLAGGIGFTRWDQLLLVSLLMTCAWLYLRSQAHRLNAFALGSGGAATVGVDADKLLQRSALVCSLLTGLGVSLAGLLGYVGLIVPHVVRRLVGNDFRASLSVAAVAGALLVVVADGFARLLLAPEELPVGVLTALLGCPVLLVLLRAQLRGRR